MIQRSAERAFDFRTAGMFEDIANNLQRVADNGDTWEKDNEIDAFKTSKLDAKFACNCGRNFSPDAMHRCVCGQTWASFVISPNEKTASQSLRIVRTIDEHRDRILASRTGSKKVADSAGMPSFVRTTDDPAPTVLNGDDSYQDQSDQSNPEIEDGGDGEPTHKLAAGGWPAPKSKNPATSKPAGPAPKPAQTTQATPPPAAPVAAPAAATAMPAAQPMMQMQPMAQPQAYPNAFGQPVQPPAQPVGQPMMTSQPGYGVNPGATPFGAPATQQPRTYKKETAMQTFSESEFKQGYLLAAADEPLPEKTAHKSFLQGYAAFYEENLKTAENAPGYDVVGKDFEKPKDGINNSMSDYTSPSKPMDDPTQDVRNDLSGKIDKDNAAGQSRDDGSMSTNLDGWKTSALLAELAKRTR